MTVRDNVYELFGPKLLEAIALVLLEEINVLRAANNQPAIQEASFLGRLHNQMDHLEEYDWNQEP